MIRELIGCAGLTVAAVGIGLLSLPAGVIAAGVFMVVYALFGFDAGKKTGL